MVRNTLFVTLILCIASEYSRSLGSATYSLGPTNINSGGTHSTGEEYALNASTAQVGGVGIITSGSYELRDGFWHAASVCLEDLDDDGDVDAFDLAVLLGNWGPYEPCPPFKVMDFDVDCDVDAANLAQLLGNWGPCP